LATRVKTNEEEVSSTAIPLIITVFVVAELTGPLTISKPLKSGAVKRSTALFTWNATWKDCPVSTSDGACTSNDILCASRDVPDIRNSSPRAKTIMNLAVSDTCWL